VRILPILSVIVLATACSPFWSTQASPALQPFRTDHVLSGPAGIVEVLIDTCGVAEPSVDAETGAISLLDRACTDEVLNLVARNNGLAAGYPTVWLVPLNSTGWSFADAPHAAVSALTNVTNRPAGLGCTQDVRFSQSWRDLGFEVSEVAWDQRDGEPGLRVSLELGSPVYDPMSGTIRDQMALADVSVSSSLTCPNPLTLAARLFAEPALFASSTHTVSVLDPTLELWLLPDPVAPRDVPVDVMVDFDFSDLRVSAVSSRLLSSLDHTSTLGLLESRGFDADAGIDRWLDGLEIFLEHGAAALSSTIISEIHAQSAVCDQWVDAQGYHVDTSSRPTCALPNLPLRSTKTPSRGR